MLWYPWWPWCKREQLHRLDSVRPSLVFNTKLFQEHRFSETCSGTWLKFPHFAMEPMQCSIASDAKSALCGSQCDRIWKWIHQSQHDLSVASFLRFTLHCWLVGYARVHKASLCAPLVFFFSTHHPATLQGMTISTSWPCRTKHPHFLRSLESHQVMVERCRMLQAPETMCSM